MKKIFFLLSILLFLVSCEKNIFQQDKDAFSGASSQSGISVQEPQVSTESGSIVLHNENCVGNICIPENFQKYSFQEYETKFGKIENIPSLFEESLNQFKNESVVYTSQKSPQNKMVETEESIIISPQKDFALKVKDEVMNTEFDIVKNYKDFSIYTHVANNCGGKSIKQEIYDASGNKIQNLDIPHIPPEVISYQGVDFERTIDFEEKFSPLDRLQKELVFSYDANFNISTQLDPLVKKEKIFIDRFQLESKQIPGILFYYSSRKSIPSSQRVVYLGTDTSWLSKNISSNGDLLNRDVTKKILGYFGMDQEINNLYVANAQYEPLETVTQADMPVFSVKKINATGDYTIYLNEKYQYGSYAEMCKPVVYYYSPKAEKNTLTLGIQKNDFFTKIIPEFNEKNGWNFSSQLNGKIQVENTKYDYLYYSLVSSNYSHNTNGWIVQGKDIAVFFEEKLSKIGFSDIEKKDFIDYWKQEYNAEKYYFVSFKYTQELEKIIPLHFSKKPDQIFRVLLDSYELEQLQEYQEKYLYRRQKEDILDSVLLKTFQRKLDQRVVFEWGGVLQKGTEIYIK